MYLIIQPNIKNLCEKKFKILSKYFKTKIGK